MYTYLYHQNAIIAGKSSAHIFFKNHKTQLTAHANNYLGQKKSPSKSTYIGPKEHIVATWNTVKKFNISTPFEGPVVLRLKYPPIWADWAEHANCYLLKEC